MLDDLTKRPNGDAQRAPEPRAAGNNVPMVDREVPLPAAPQPFDAMHRWLDNEASEEEVAGSEGARYTELWRRVDVEVESRRQMAAPVGLADRIMLAVPETVPQPMSAAMNWWEKPVELTPVKAVAAASGILALGLAIGATLRDR